MPKAVIAPLGKRLHAVLQVADVERCQCRVRAPRADLDAEGLVRCETCGLVMVTDSLACLGDALQVATERMRLAREGLIFGDSAEASPGGAL